MKKKSKTPGCFDQVVMRNTYKRGGTDIDTTPALSSEWPSAHSSLTWLSLHLLRLFYRWCCFSFAGAEFSQLLQLFHCNPGIVTRENRVSSCFGCMMADALPLCWIVQKSFQNHFVYNHYTALSFFTSEWQKLSVAILRSAGCVLFCKGKWCKKKQKKNRRTKRKTSSVEAFNVAICQSWAAPAPCFNSLSAQTSS